MSQDTRGIRGGFWIIAGAVLAFQGLMWGLVFWLPRR